MSSKQPLELWVVEGVPVGLPAEELACQRIRVSRATREQILSHPVVHEVVRMLVECLHEEYHSDACDLETCSFWLWPEGSK